MSAFYERGCICPEIACPYHPTPNRPFDKLAEAVAEDFYRAAKAIVESEKKQSEKKL